MTDELSSPYSNRHLTDERAHAGVAVEVLVCGTVDRGDDAAPTVAIGLVAPILGQDVRTRQIRMLDVDDLLSVPVGAGVVVVDAATGIEPGHVVQLPLTALIGEHELRPRSSRALAIPEVLGLADVIRGRPLRGRIVAVGGTAFGLHRSLSRRVRAALPALVAEIADAVEQVRPPDEPALATHAIATSRS